MRFIYFVLFSVLISVCVCANYTCFDYHRKVGIPLAFSINLKESETRIVGGTQTSLGQFGFQAGILIYLTTGWTSICGGSLVSPTRLITAAHCWWDGRSQALNFTVVLGSTRISTGGTRVEASNVIVHPSWNAQDITHDVAIVVIPAVSYSNNIYDVPLPEISDANESFEGYSAVASGYGVTNDAVHVSLSSATLYHVVVPIISNSECQLTFQSSIHGSHICTSGVGGRGTCDGDSGGPLTALLRNRRTLVGISSFRLAEGCQREVPSVFTRVTALLNWIYANMG